MHDSLGQEVPLERLAGIAGLSANHFLRVFRQALGTTPHRYLLELRIARACELLLDPSRTLVEVTYTLGFSSQSHLTAVFRRYMKTTPAVYRAAVLSPPDELARRLGPALEGAIR